jgi:c-di-GMP-binding flagellar brake protein YcgR
MMDRSNVNKQVASRAKKETVIAVEKRKHPRISVELPVDYSRPNGKNVYGGIVANASEGGVLVYLPERLEIGAVLKVEILYVKGLELNTIKAIAKVVWGDLTTRESLGEHQYGLQFQYIDEEDFQRLITLLKEARK